MSRTLPAWLPRVLFESALIVFSVLLALMLNEWRSAAGERERMELALEAIRSELQENRRLIEDAREYHTHLLASFTASSRRGDPLPDLEGVTRGVLSPGRVLRTAWESAQQTGATSRMPYETVLRLSTVYAQQAEYEVLSHAMLQAAYQRVLEEGIDAMLRQYPNFILLQQDFVAREEVLTAYYDEALSVIPAR